MRWRSFIESSFVTLRTAPSRKGFQKIITGRSPPSRTPKFARTVAGTAYGRIGELAPGSRVYVDVTLRGAGNEGMPIAVVGKDTSVWALDLAG